MTEIDLTIPEFLDRKLHPELSSPTQPEQGPVKPEETEEQRVERIIRKLATQRRYMTPTSRRPRLSKMIAEVRAEFKEKGWL